MTGKEEKSLKFLHDISDQLYKYDYADVKPWLQDYVPIVPIPIIISESFPRLNTGGPYKDPKYLYRACENETLIETKATMKLPWKNVGRILHAPTEYAHKVPYGRANLPGQARFYCSNYLPTACVECITSGFVEDQSQDTTVTLGAWKIKEPLVLAEISFSPKKLKEVKHFNPLLYEERINFTKSWYDHILEKFEKQPMGDFSRDYMKELLEFFSDEFGKTNIKSGRDYILSNYYAELVFAQNFHDDPNTLDGILYPSVKYSYQEFNIVLHPRAMRKISFQHASQIWIVYNSQSRSVSINPLETSFKDEHENLGWNKFKY